MEKKVIFALATLLTASNVNAQDTFLQHRLKTAYHRRSHFTMWTSTLLLAICRK